MATWILSHWLLWLLLTIVPAVAWAIVSCVMFANDNQSDPDTGIGVAVLWVMGMVCLSVVIIPSAVLFLCSIVIAVARVTGGV